ncbi:MAG: 23S rRNA (pseudouridine(1915)-N(3))-methyltransferase RlmH [Alphaproteobacteria bacterium]|nr:MAG: 23S rRNA (pseudouridine(1915)-N(3))-methyltransferase RlmH [Alphaproteobacteria bacterium]
MRIVVAAVGRLKRGPEQDLAERYRARAAKSGRGVGLRALDVIEVAESRARDAGRRMLEESIALANVIPKDAATVLLDPRGEALDSGAFAKRLRGWNDAGRDVAFLVGGPDGLAPTLADQADLHLAFGALTWPHQLARVMLLEQIYRAVTILSGHPYHRE